MKHEPRPSALRRPGTCIRTSAEWFRFDNATAQSTSPGPSVGRTTEFVAPVALPREEGAYLRVQLSSIDGPAPSWEKPIDVFFRFQYGQWQLVGVDRLPS